MIEKHKMNVPETMNEVLDMSDDDGKVLPYSLIVVYIWIPSNPSKTVIPIQPDLRNPGKTTKVHKI